MPAIRRIPTLRRNPPSPPRSAVSPSQTLPLPPPPPKRPQDRDGCLRAEENLRGYLARAELPSIARWDRTSPYCLPPKDKRSKKNKLRVRKDPSRHIENIRQHNTNAFNAATRKYHKHYIYGKSWRPFTGKRYAQRQGEALVLKAQDFVPEEELEDTPYPNNIDDTCVWLKNRPFKTMQRAIHLAFPDTTRWWLDEVETEMPRDSREQVFANRDKWRAYVWRFHPDGSQPAWWRDVRDPESGKIKTEAAPRDTMAVVVQAPWILARKDMIKVIECTSLPSLPDDDVHPESRLNSQRRVWANLHDTCKRLDCRSFVLTTYHCWMFGKFSEDMKSVEISEVKDFDAKKPTVMQMLVYWVAGSMGLEGTGDVEVVEKVKVREEPEAGPSTKRELK